MQIFIQTIYFTKEKQTPVSILSKPKKSFAVAHCNQDKREIKDNKLTIRNSATFCDIFKIKKRNTVTRVSLIRNGLSETQ
jgi:hypothetical protein